MHQLDKHDFLLWIRFCRDHMLSSQIRAFWNQTNEIWPRLIKWVELLNVIFEAGGFLDKCVPHAQAAARWAALEYSGRRPRWWREALEAKRRERERRLLRSDLVQEKPFILSLQTGGGKDNGDCDKEQRTGGYWRRLQISVVKSRELHQTPHPFSSLIIMHWIFCLWQINQPNFCHPGSRNRPWQ